MSEEEINQSKDNSPPSTEGNKTVEQPLTINNEPITNMEIHHHPKAEKKNFKEYFREFLMIFLAVTLGFFAEQIRERFINHEKEKHYIENILANLKTDTANISSSYQSQYWLLKNMDDVLKLPVGKLTDPFVQNTLYQHIVPFYAGFWIFIQDNTTETQLKNASGFSVFSNQDVIDSISEVYYFYDTWVKMNEDLYVKSYEKTGDLATQLFRLPESNIPFNDTGAFAIPGNGEVLIQYNKILLEQLYSSIRYQKGQLSACIEIEKAYGQQVESLIKFLEREYDLK